MKTLLILILGVSFWSVSVYGVDLGQRDTLCIANKADLSKSDSEALNKSTELTRENDLKSQILVQ